MDDLQNKPSVLVVDDVRENLIAVTNLIKVSNARVFSASGGSEALEIVREEKLAICILDVQMPGMNGYELAGEIRKSKLNADTPIIFLTAVHIDQSSVFKGYQKGAVDYITKPINKDILLMKVQVFLKLEEVRSKLERAEKRYESIVREQPDLVFRFNSRFQLTFVNKSMCRLFQMKADELIGYNLFELFPDIIPEQYQSEIKQLKPGQNSHELEHRLFPGEQSRREQRWFVHNVTGIANEYQAIDEYQAVCHDITVRKKMEMQLIDAKKKAEAATESKSRFLANMSHEIRTPMSAIIGMADLLKENELPDEAAESVDVIKISANNLLSIVNEILDFSKIEANQIDIEYITFNLREQFQDVIKVFEYSAANKNIKLLHQTDDSFPERVIGDPMRFRQILTNLISNAIKFTQDGNVEVKAVTQNQDKTGVTVKISVRDTGIGIKAEGIDRLFKPFSQTDPDTRRKYGGTGLGLAISKNLTELMGGTIGVESKPGEGSLFWFSLPFKFAMLEDEKLTNKPGKQKKTADDPLDILIVEDNLLNQKVAAATLRKLGHSIDIANNGKEGVDKAINNHYDLIVMDIQMPVMNGLDATKAIRNHERDNNIACPVKIVALTANALLNDRDICLQAGMDEYISKPFKKEDFLRVLKVIM